MLPPSASKQNVRPSTYSRTSSAGPSSYELLNPQDSSHHTGSPDLTEGLFDDKPSAWTRCTPYIAMLLQITVISFLILVIPLTIWLPFTTTARRLLYTTGVAILASVISSFVTSRILWLQDLLQGHRSMSQRVHRAQTLLLVGSFQHQLKNIEITLALLLFGLMTSAIIGALTPTSAGRLVPSWSALYTGLEYYPDNGVYPIGVTTCWTYDPAQGGY